MNALEIIKNQKAKENRRSIASLANASRKWPVYRGISYEPDFAARVAKQCSECGYKITTSPKKLTYRGHSYIN